MVRGRVRQSWLSETNSASNPRPGTAVVWRVRYNSLTTSYKNLEGAPVSLAPIWKVVWTLHEIDGAGPSTVTAWVFLHEGLNSAVLYMSLMVERRVSFVGAAEQG